MASKLHFDPLMKNYTQETSPRTIIAAPTSLADYTSPPLIVPRLQGKTMPAVMKELTQALHQADGFMPKAPFDSLQALVRELLTGLAMDFGACFPSVRVPGLQRPRFALGRTAQPFAWRAKTFPPIEFVFLVVAPTPSTGESKRLAETLSRLGTDRLRLTQLGATQSAQEMHAVLALCPLVGDAPLAQSQTRLWAGTSHPVRRTDFKGASLRHPVPNA
jgi:mannitol/fructose-specific phosphotransferase system IIA component (Ntr-type)